MTSYLKIHLKLRIDLSDCGLKELAMGFYKISTRSTGYFSLLNHILLIKIIIKQFKIARDNHHC